MLSEDVLRNFSGFINLSTKMYSIPSMWNPVSRQFDPQTRKHKIIERMLAVFEILVRIWFNVAYGFMIYKNLQEPSTVIEALIPITYLCCINWVATIRYVSHVNRIEVEQFLNQFFKLNAYLG